MGLHHMVLEVSGKLPVGRRVVFRTRLFIRLYKRRTVLVPGQQGVGIGGNSQQKDAIMKSQVACLPFF